MNKYITIIFVAFLGFSKAQTYAPAAGETGTTAIAHDSTIIKSWATHVEIERGFVNISDTSVYYQGSNKATFGAPVDAIGPASNISTDAVSLGDSGIAIVTFLTPIMNGTGPDFAVFENGVTNTFLELAHVEVSSDGINYVRFPSHSLTQTNNEIGGFGMVQPTDIHNLAGKYKVGFGTPFDLEELSDSTGIDINSITHIKIIDVVGSLDEHGTHDAQGNLINDPFPTPFGTGGFDLNAVGVIHEQVLNLNYENYTYSIYPNPSRGIINIQFDAPQIKEIRITNNIGQNVQVINVNNSKQSIQTNLPKGIYFIQFIGKNSIHSEKIVVK